MRKYIKRQMAELLDTMSEAVEMLPEAAGENNRSQFTNLLADQQDAAMAVGEQIEASEGEGTKAVQLLEQYCELLWEINQQPYVPITAYDGFPLEEIHPSAIFIHNPFCILQDRRNWRENSRRKKSAFWIRRWTWEKHSLSVTRT